MNLTMKPTFEVVGYPCQYVVRKGEPQRNAFLKYMAPFFLYAYPNGGEDGEECTSLSDAHHYLLSMGSESPLEEVAP